MRPFWAAFPFWAGEKFNNMTDIKGRKSFFNARRGVVLVLLFLAGVLFWLPTGYEQLIDPRAVRCRGLVQEVDNSEVQQMGIVRVGAQRLSLKILNGPFEGKILTGYNQLLGKLEMDKIFVPGDVALVVLTRNDQGEITYALPQDHYRLRLEIILFVLFAVLLLALAGVTGAKALLSFVLSALMIWKVMVPAFLNGYNPVLVSLGVVSLLCAVVIFLVGGFNRKGLVAFLGSLAGVVTACVLALIFTKLFHLNGAVKPFSETLLYTGYAHLDLSSIFVAAVFIASSGAMMDLAMDVAASLDEIKSKAPDITRKEAAASGLRVGRAVVGTMTTTLLFAYSGGYITLLMVFMAQGVPLANLFNLVYVSAEVLNTLVGSFGLVTVAPFTALIGALFYGVSDAGEKNDGVEQGLQPNIPSRNNTLSSKALNERTGSGGSNMPDSDNSAKLWQYEVMAAVFQGRAGESVARGEFIGRHWETGEDITAEGSGTIVAVTFNQDHHSLLVTIEQPGGEA